MRDCDIEFGPDHNHDDDECDEMLYIMNGGHLHYSDFADAYNREQEEYLLGRPLFPNEY